jgi:hypothetical protein
LKDINYTGEDEDPWPAGGGGQGEVTTGNIIDTVEYI